MVIAAGWLGLSGGLAPMSRVVVAFVLAEAIAFVLLLGLSVRMPVTGPPPSPQSEPQLHSS